MKECKCGNYKPYIETMKPGVGYAPMMPFTACVNCYGANQSNEPTIADLQKENDELRHKLDKYIKSACQTCYGAGTVMIAIDDGMECPECAQSLAEVKAEAEAKGAIKLLSGLTGNVSSLIKDAEDGGNNDLLLSLMFMQRMVEEYANKLKGGEL